MAFCPLALLSFHPIVRSVKNRGENQNGVYGDFLEISRAGKEVRIMERKPRIPKVESKDFEDYKKKYDRLWNIFLVLLIVAIGSAFGLIWFAFSLGLGPK